MWSHFFARVILPILIVQIVCARRDIFLTAMLEILWILSRWYIFLDVYFYAWMHVRIIIYLRLYMYDATYLFVYIRTSVLNFRCMDL